jgi:hypothetical protein
VVVIGCASGFDLLEKQIAIGRFLSHYGPTPLPPFLHRISNRLQICSSRFSTCYWMVFAPIGDLSPLVFCAGTLCR